MKKDTTKEGQIREQPTTEPKKDSGDETEFKVTVRKLEVPVRPRGVLAE
jgi:hypothetical protein